MSSKLTKCLVGLALTSLLVVGYALVVAPGDVEALGGCSGCYGPLQSTMGWGHGSTCTISENAAKNNARSNALFAGCYPCNQSYTYTNHCQLIGGVYHTDVRMDHYCMDCGDP